MIKHLPKVKKKVKAFLLGEEGKISKDSILRVGAFVSGVTIAGSIMAKSASAGWKHGHGPDSSIGLSLGVDNSTKVISVEHKHHSSHSNHSSGGGC